MRAKTWTWALGAALAAIAVASCGSVVVVASASSTGGSGHTSGGGDSAVAGTGGGVQGFGGGPVMPPDAGGPGVGGSVQGSGGGPVTPPDAGGPGAGGGVQGSGGGPVDAGGPSADAGDGGPGEDAGDDGPIVDASDGGMPVTGPGTALRTSNAPGSYVLVPGLTIPADFTMEIWIDPDTVQGGDQLMLTKEQGGDPQNQFRLGLNNGRPYLMMCDAALAGNMWNPQDGYRLIAPQQVTPAVWTHVAVTKSGTQFALYVNGQLASTFTTDTNLIHTGQHPFEIATRFGDDAYFIGTFDEIRVWSVARTADEIAANMGTTIQPTDPDYASLVAYYRLDDGVGPIASDTTGMYPGTLEMGPQWVVSTAPIGP